MLMSTRSGQPVRLPDGMTHAIPTPRGLLANATACGQAWRPTGRWVDEEAEIDCMACLARRTT